MGKTHFRIDRILSIFMLSVIFIVPIFFLALKSIGSEWRFPMLFPNEITFTSWEIVLHDTNVISSIYTTIEIAIFVVLLNFLLGFPAAKALSQKTFKGKNVVETIIFLPILIPALAIAMGLHLTMIRLGLADHKIGVILIHVIPTLPYSIRILRAGFDRIGSKWEDQAKTLGLSPIATFLFVTIPLLFPSIRSTALLTFVISLSQYGLTAIIGGGRVTTLPLLFYPYFNNANESIVSAFAILFACLPVVFLLILEVIIGFYKYVVRM